MKLGPGGASGFENGWLAIQASKAVLNAGLKRRTYSAASASLPFSLAWIHVLNVETSSNDPDGRRGAVALGLAPVPPRRLIAAPRGGDGNEREHDRLGDLDEPFPAQLLGLFVRALGLGQPAGDLHVEVF